MMKGARGGDINIVSTLSVCSSNRLFHLDDKVKHLKHWIAASDWTKSYDEAERRRLEESGEWFIGHSIYRSWARSSVEDEGLETSIAPPLLIISGTYLSCYTRQN